MTNVRLWLWRLFFVGGCIGIYSILEEPLDILFAILIGLALAIWFYNLASSRFNLRPVAVRFERVETITPNHILLTLILLVLLACHAELVHLRRATNDVRDSVTDVQNSASDNTDEIKDGLDDVKRAVEANQ